jgi:AsmA protein
MPGCATCLDVVMPKWIRFTLIGLAAALLVAVVGIAIFVASFDPNRYKGVAIDWMREHKQRTLVIDGPISLSVFPHLALTVRKVSLSERARPDVFAAVEEASLSVRLLPLLRKELSIDHVSARGVNLVYLRDGANHTNFEDLVEPAPPAQTPAASAAPAAHGGSFDIDGIELREVQAVVRDVPAGIDGRILVNELTTGRLASGLETPVKLVARTLLAKPAADMSVELSTRMHLEMPSGAAASVALRDTELSIKGKAFGVDALDAQLSGALGYDGATRSTTAGPLKLRVSGRRLGLDLKDSTLALDKLVYAPAETAVELAGLDAQIQGTQAGAPLVATLKWPQLAVHGTTLKGGPLSGKATLGGDLKLQVQLDSGAPQGSFDRVLVPAVTAHVQGEGQGRSVQGEISTDLTLQPRELAAALEKMRVQLGFKDPSLAPLTLAATGRAEGSPKRAAWSLEGSLNEQRFSTEGTARLEGRVPFVDARAQFAALDLSHFMAPEKRAAAAARAGASAASPAQAASAPPPSGEPIDMSVLSSLDAKLALRADSLVYPPYRADDLVLEAAIDAGVLRVRQLSARTWGGSVNAQATASAQGNRVTAKLDAKQVDLRALLRDVAQYDKLEGRGNVSADLSSTATTAAAARSTLAGRASIDVRDASVHGVNLAKSLRQWRSAISLNRDEVQKASMDEKTDFSEMRVSFDIRDGVARSNDLVAQSPFLRVGGEGAIDIGRSRVDYVARATVTSSTEGQGGPELAALKGVTVPVELEGPMDSVTYRVRWTEVAASLLEAKARGALGKGSDVLRAIIPGTGAHAATPAAGASAPAPKKPEDELKDRLRGLLGR